MPTSAASSSADQLASPVLTGAHVPARARPPPPTRARSPHSRAVPDWRAAGGIDMAGGATYGAYGASGFASRSSFVALLVVVTKMRLGVAFLIYVAVVLCASLALAAPAAKSNGAALAAPNAAALAAPNAAATPTEAERKPPASIFGVLAGHLRAYAPGRGQHATPPGA